MQLPKSFYKYQSGTQQITAESSEQFILNEIGTDINGDSLLINIEGGMFPYKNFSDAEGVFRANMVKSLFIESIKIISKWYFIPALILCDKQEVLNAFNRIAFRISSEKILKDRHWSKFAKSFYFVIFYFLYKSGFTEDSCDKFAEIFCYMIDADNAYRLRLEDLFSASSIEQLTENPRKETKRLITLFQEREQCPVVAIKFSKLSFLLSIFLLIPKVKRSFIDTFKNCDYESLKSDSGDLYWQGMRNDYNFSGLTFEERQNRAIMEGLKYPQQIKIMKKKITEEQIQIVMNALQKANVGIQDYVAIQTMFQNLEGELPKIPDVIIKPEEK